MPTPNHTIENVLGTIGAICWTIQIIPQIYKSWKEKSTHGLSTALMFIWSLSALPFSAYIVAQKLSIPLQIQPHAFGFLCTVSTIQCLYYGHHYSKTKALLCLLAFCTIWAGFETGSIYAIRAGQDHGTKAPLLLYGYLSSVLLAVALLPQYWEIYKLKEVVGISLVFMAIDIAGGLFSFLSLLYRPELDIAAVVSYLLVVILDGIVVILAFILNPLARRRRRREEERAIEEELRIGAAGPTTQEEDDNLSGERTAVCTPTERKNSLGGVPQLGVPSEMTEGIHIHSHHSHTSVAENVDHGAHISSDGSGKVTNAK